MASSVTRHRWTVNDALDALQRYAALIGRTPTLRDLRRAPVGVPRDATLYRLFGALREAQRLAGMAPNPAKGPRPGVTRKAHCRRGHRKSNTDRQRHCRECSALHRHRHGVPVPQKRCRCGMVLKGRAMKCQLCKRHDQLAGRPRRYWQAA